MIVIDFIGDFGGWSWIVFGLILLGIELLAPGAFMMWLGGAAILTGVLALLFGFAWPLQWFLFGVLSVVLVAWWMAYSKRGKDQAVEGESQLINQRTARLFGQEATLVDAIHQGAGRVRIDDTVWRVTGPDLPAGAIVRITSARGNVLVVEPLA
jgi:inner membrane protein